MASSVGCINAAAANTHPVSIVVKGVGDIINHESSFKNMDVIVYESNNGDKNWKKHQLYKPVSFNKDGNTIIQVTNGKYENLMVQFRYGTGKNDGSLFVKFNSCHDKFSSIVAHFTH